MICKNCDKQFKAEPRKAILLESFCCDDCIRQFTYNLKSNAIENHCIICQNFIEKTGKRGPRPRVCSEHCRSKYKSMYHTLYDGCEEQLERRRLAYHGKKL